MKIQLLQYNELPDWVDKNSYGSKYANYLVIEDGNYRKVYCDQMEPEDVRFTRDLKWVKEEIERAYKSGLKEGEENTRDYYDGR